MEPVHAETDKRATRTPRAAWIEAGFRALAAGGPGAVRVEALAKSLGVTKGGFYWHFDGRAALLEEMLDAWENAMIDDVIARIEEAGGDAREKLRSLFSLARSDEARDLLRVDLAIRNWSRRDEAVAGRLRRVDNRRMRYMRELFAAFCPDEAEVEARCLIAFSIFVGTPFIAVDHPGRTRGEVVALALTRLAR